jgi:hypothetical protein
MNSPTSSIARRGGFAMLKAAGVLGMNRRNLDYIGRWNPRESFPFAGERVLSLLRVDKKNDSENQTGPLSVELNWRTTLRRFWAGFIAWEDSPTK